MQNDETANVVFGAFDGLMTSLGAVLAMLLQQQSPAHLFNVIIGIAAGAGVSMTYGQYLASGHEFNDSVISIGIATTFGSALPAVPFLIWHGFWAYFICLLLLWGVCQLVGRLRGRDKVLIREVYVGVVLVIGVVFLLELVTGGIS